VWEKQSIYKGIAGRQYFYNSRLFGIRGKRMDNAEIKNPGMLLKHVGIFIILLLSNRAK